MQLSILLPTHRHDLLALSRVAQVCSWAAPAIEVIVRDNSGNVQKREALSRFQRENCKIISVDPCGPRENYLELLSLAKGAFVFTLADDDMSFDRAIAALPAIIEKIAKDTSVIGITGTYIVEASAGSVAINYKAIDSADVTARVAGYLNETGPNVLYYSALRTDAVRRIVDLLYGMPMLFSFQDQILSLLYLLNGKFHILPRLFYLYDFGAWEKTETAQQLDIGFYTTAGLDPAINMLHWFLCGFEGAVLALHSGVVADHTPAQRQAIANLWFSAMFSRFKGHKRQTSGSAMAVEIEKSCGRLQAMAGTVTFGGMLKEISSAIAIVSEVKAQVYLDYWDKTLNRR